LSGTLARSVVDRVPVDSGAARLRFGDGRMAVESSGLWSDMAVAEASGARGIAPHVTDALSLKVSADSLGPWRRYLMADLPVDSAADSIAGRAELNALFSGTLARMSPGADSLTRRGLAVDA